MLKINIAFVSLGCDKNLVDSEVMLGILEYEKFNFTTDYELADLIIVNTCCFIKDALEESIETILEVSKYKEIGKCKGIIVTGCLGQRYKEELFDEMPEVDAIVGTTAYTDILDACNDVLAGKKVLNTPDINAPIVEVPNVNRKLSTTSYFGYLKISEGCDNFCTYCIIPKIRGKHRSRSLENLIEEARYLASCGVKELIIVAQDTSIYGRDIYGEPMLHELLKRLCKIEDLKWIRLLYAYPETLTEKTIEVMSLEDKICKYIDLPIQHSCDTVLKRMGRKTTNKTIKDKIALLRKYMPEISIRTTFIVGFPGETDEEFEQLYDFASEIKFDRLGVFTYSQEDTTPAATMPNQIDEDVKEIRRNAIMQKQVDISASKCQNSIGKTFDVIVDGYVFEENIYCGRTFKDAPDIDGLVFINCDYELISGDIVKVLITEASDYDLIGSVVDCDEST